MSAQEQLVAGRYRLLRTLATGGTGPVWLAADDVRRCQVAIKRGALPSGLKAEEKELVRGLALRETHAFARVAHPNVIRILDVLPGEDEPWIVMEYVPSRSLLQVIQETGPLSPERAAAVGLAVVRGLTAAGQVGVLHLDVKPANVLMGDDGRIVLSDFGPAVTEEGVRTLADAGIVLGSAKYVAPERLLGGAATAQADLWSLGATLYHAVEGHPPYLYDTIEATLEAVAAGPPEPPRQAGPLAGVLAGLLQRNPAARLLPSEAEALLSRLAEPPAPPSRSPATVPRRPRRSRPPLARRAAAFAAVLAVVGGLGGVGAAAGRQAGAGSAVAGSVPLRAALVLPADFGWWTDPGGFRIAVPSGWRHGRDAAGELMFNAPAGWPSLRISSVAATPPTAVAALIGEENKLLAERDEPVDGEDHLRLTSYRRIRIEALPEPSEAVWEYTFRGPTGVPMRGLQRVRAVGGRTYVIEWRAPSTAWAAGLQRLAVVLNSFGPVPGA